MTKEQINIAIAEECGWTGFNPDNIPDCLQYTARSPSGKWGLIPDYLNDLNAMHEAVLSVLNVASSQLNWDYCRILGEVTGSGEHVTTALVHATAAQRAEAFLRTIKKWEGGSDE
jgi:hypothetical protein